MIDIYSNNTTNIINSNINSKNGSTIFAGVNYTPNINIKDSNFYVDSDKVLIQLSGSGTTVIDGGTYSKNMDAGTSNGLIGVLYGKLIIKNGNFTTNNVNVSGAEKANIYISGGNFKSTTSAWYRGSVKLNQNNGNVYISGGTFDNPNGGSVVSFQGTSDSGNAYICNANIISGRDYYNIENLAGTLYYSANVKFSNGTNTPTGTGDFLSSNYTGSCNP